MSIAGKHVKVPIIKSVSVPTNASSIYLPELAVASIAEKDVDLYEKCGLQIASLGSPLSPLIIDLPSLCNVSGINIVGFVQEYRQTFYL